MPLKVVVGLQWGDEGKGKIIDIFSKNMDFVVRAQGGNNAGHTIQVDQNQYKFHLIPSGVLHPQTICLLGAGTVIDLEALLEEIDLLEKEGIALENRFFISLRAHVIFPYHKKLDLLQERQKETKAIGTTGRGIGPCYADKINRVGIRVADLLSEENLKKKLQNNLKQKNALFQKIFEEKPLSFEKIYMQCLDYKDRLEKYFSDVEQKIFTAVQNKKKILLEGAQGSLLDINFGTYPFVTSSSTIVSGIANSLGLVTQKNISIFGVAKAYLTRVGNGPFPTEFSDEDKTFFDFQQAREIGTTTGRKRRVGWLDLVLLRYSIQMNSVDFLAITKLDILDSLKEIKICIGYNVDGKKQDTMTTELEKARPIYKILSGWEQSTKDTREYKNLPENAKIYLETLSEYCHTPIQWVSVGPKREQVMEKVV